MTTIYLYVSGAVAHARVSGVLTSGMAGVPVEIRWDSPWEGLRKTLVCRGGEQLRLVPDVGSSAVLPQEVLLANRQLELGLEGRNENGDLVIPTVWADCGVVEEGAFSGQMTAGADLQQILESLGDLNDLNTEERESLVAAVNEVWEKTGQMDEKKVQQLLEQYLAENPRSYEALLDRPAINGVTLSGNRTTAELGIGLPTDGQVAEAVGGWLEEHPEATTTVADGSITGEKLAHGAVTPEKLSDLVFATRIGNHVKSDGGFPMFTFPLEGLEDTTVSVHAEIELLSSDEPITFNLACSQSEQSTQYGELRYAESKTLDGANPCGAFTCTVDVTDKPYLTAMIQTGHKVCAFVIRLRAEGGGRVLTWTEVTPQWGDVTVETNKVLEMQDRGTLATYETVRKLTDQAEQGAKAYTDQALEAYAYEIPENSVGLSQLSGDLFALDRECVITVKNRDFAFLGFDLTPAGDYVGKTAVMEYYYQILGDNWKETSIVCGLGNSLFGYNHLDYGGSFTVVDEEKKIHKVTDTYTLENGGYSMLLLCPSFITDGNPVDIKFYGMNVTVGGVKLKWVEAGALDGSIPFEISVEQQEGDTVAKVEYVQNLIDQATQSTKEEVEQLRELIGGDDKKIVESPLNGKKWCVIGDSISYGSGTTDERTTYHKFIADKYLVLVDNRAFPGKCVTAYPDHGDNMMDDLNSASTDCDMITIMGGTNDFGHSLPIGDPGDTGVETFYGAVKHLCETLYSKFGTKKFAFFTPVQRSDGASANQQGKVLKDYRDVILEVCADYSVPVLDLYSVGGINPAKNNSFTVDGLHLNDAGHERISNAIAKFLEQL